MELRQLTALELGAVIRRGEVSVAEAAQAGFLNLKGHRLSGGMRASVYNAMPLEGAQRLADFIRRFDKAN